MFPLRLGPNGAAIALLLVAAWPAGTSAQILQPEVLDVRFQGNETFPDDSLSRAITTRATECRGGFLLPACLLGRDFAFERSYLSQREVGTDRSRLVVFYRQRGFRDAAVDTATSLGEEGATVTFGIVEGRPVLVDSLRFTGPDSVFDEGLLDDLPLRARDRLSSLRLDATRQMILSRLRDRGYAHAEVFRVVRIPTDSYAATVVLEVEPGPPVRFGDIAVQGTSSLSPSTILRTLPFGPGDPYRASDLLEGQRRLFGLGVVQSATVRDSAAFGDTVAPVRVTVREGDVHRVRAGAGLSSAECVALEARWASLNFIGGGRTLELRARTANLLARDFYEILCPQAGGNPFNALTWLASADFTQPWILSTRNTLTTSIFAERQSLPDVFVREAVGGALGVTRVLGSRTLLRLSYAFELSTLEATEFLWCSGFLICDPEDVQVLQQFNRLASVGVNVTTNEVDNLLNPTGGYVAVVDAEHAAGWTGSTFRYDRFLAEASWYDGFAPGGVFAARIRGGWVGSGGFARTLVDPDQAGVIHPEKRFYAGGANSVRGFAQGRLGPRVLVLEDPLDLLESSVCAPAEIMDLSCDPGGLDEGVFDPRPSGGTRLLEGNLEVRLRLSSDWQAVTFTDFGQVWSVAEPVELDTVEFSPGVGLRYLSPIGPLRVDLAYRFRGASRLPVVTTQIRESTDPEVPAGTYEATEELAPLSTRYFYGESRSLDLLRRLQLHLSIGQAF